MVVTGLALLGTVAWHEWSTGVRTARVQRVLQADQRFPVRPIPGGALGLISIPRIRVRLAFVEGVGADALAEGPGHYPGTPMPGMPGNVAIAGHRTTHGAPFWSLDQVRPGDMITLQTHAGTFEYRVQWQRVVDQGGWWITHATGQRSLTLSTCTPRFTSLRRLVVRALEVSELPWRVRGWRIPGPAQPVLL